MKTEIKISSLKEAIELAVSMSTRLEDLKSNIYLYIHEFISQKRDEYLRHVSLESVTGTLVDDFIKSVLGEE